MMAQENHPAAQSSHSAQRPTTLKQRTTNVDNLVTIFGVAGFLGRHVVRALAERHCRLRIAVRHPYFIEHLQRLGRPRQIRAVRADVRFPRLSRLLVDCRTRQAPDRATGEGQMDVPAWLRNLGLERYEQAFRDNEIDAEAAGTAAAPARPLGPEQDQHVGPVTSDGERRQLTVMFADLAGFTATRTGTRR